MEIARKESWKAQPMPQETAALGYTAEFSLEEFERMSRGLIPQHMDDKWFIYLEGATLYLHRSWTGFCIYQVEFARGVAKYTVHRALVNRDQAQYQGTDIAYEVALLRFLISNLLLGMQVEFPVPTQFLRKTPKGLLQHHVSGTAYSEKSAETRPWWKFW